MRKLRIITFAMFLLFAWAGSVTAQNSTVAIAPMKFRGLMPVIEVKLNGQGPFAFTIDTGAGMQADIDTSVAAQLKLQPNGRVLNGDPSGENDREVETATINTLAFGGAEMDELYITTAAEAWPSDLAPAGYSGAAKGQGGGLYRTKAAVCGKSEYLAEF